MGKFRNLIYLVGACRVGSLLGEFALHTYNHHFREEWESQSLKERLTKRYNAHGGKWAIVTGASDGIGKQLSLKLADSGFNLVLASRSQHKLEGVKADILSKNPNLNVKVVPIDLS